MKGYNRFKAINQAVEKQQEYVRLKKLNKQKWQCQDNHAIIATKQFPSEKILQLSANEQGYFSNKSP